MSNAPAKAWHAMFAWALAPPTRRGHAGQLQLRKLTVVRQWLTVRWLAIASAVSSDLAW